MQRGLTLGLSPKTERAKLHPPTRLFERRSHILITKNTDDNHTTLINSKIDKMAFVHAKPTTSPDLIYSEVQLRLISYLFKPRFNAIGVCIRLNHAEIQQSVHINGFEIFIGPLT